MSAAMGDEVSDEIAVGQRQIAHQVEGLVTNAFVSEAQFIFQRPVLIEHQHVLIGRPFAQSARYEPQIGGKEPAARTGRGAAAATS